VGNVIKKTRRVEIVLDEDEPFFVLRGNSPLSPQLVQIWAAAAKLIGSTHPEKIRQAYAAAEQMREYLKKHDRQEFPILAAIEQSLVLGVEDATPPTTSKETH
jgi:hypothetical protein